MQFILLAPLPWMHFFKSMENPLQPLNYGQLGVLQKIIYKVGLLNFKQSFRLKIKNYEVLL